MKIRNKKPSLRGRTRQTQRMRMRVVVAVASFATLLTTMLVLYFQLYKRETSYAKEVVIEDMEKFDRKWFYKQFLLKFVILIVYNIYFYRT